MALELFKNKQQTPTEAKLGWLKKKKITGKDIGLKVLFRPDEIDDIEVDIVAVHGIGVHPADTWVHKDNKANWLADPNMLPAAIPKARIMAFGYKSYWFGDDAVKQTLDGIAVDLLYALGDERADCLQRPIIFVGHCFGGLVMQQVYTLASINKIDYPGIFDSVTGMVFLGTPHSGVSGKSGLQTQGQLYDVVVKANVEIQDNILRTVAQDNDLLVKAVHDFTRAVTNEGACGPKLFCFYEQQTSKVGVIQFVVDESSGTLNGHEKSYLSLDHFHMNKFEEAEDNNFKKVCSQIVKMGNGSKAIMNRRGLASEQPPAALSSSSSRNRLTSVPAPIARESHLAPRDDILKRVETGFEKTTKQVLYGDSGNGKTHIAVEYSHNFHREHPSSAVHWVNAASAAQFELSYKRIAENLHINKKVLKGESIVEEVYNTLKQDVNSHWLMVLDGLDDETDLKATEIPIIGKLLLDFIPDSPLARILVTTRSKTLAMRIVNNKHDRIINVSTLKEDDASFLLLGRHTSNPAKKKTSIDLAKALGGSAGTITLAYLHCRLAKITLKSYMERIEPQKAPVKTDSGTMRAWRLLFEPIQEEHPNDAGLVLLIGTLDVQSIPKVFFERAQLSEQLQRLEERGMVEPSSDGRLYTMTGIVRECVQTWLKENKEKEIFEEQALSVMCDRFKEKDYHLGEVLLPCALAVLKFRPESPKGKRSLANLLSRVADYYAAMRQYHISYDHLKRCLHLRQEEQDSEKKSILIAETRQAIEEVKSKLAQTKAERKASLKEDKSTARVAEAKKELSALQKSDKSKHSDVIRKANDLAGFQLLQGKKDNPKEVVALYQRVLDWSKKSSGEYSMDTARRKYNLALAHDEAGEYDAAAELYQSASQIAERHLEPSHPEFLRILASLACMYGRQGRLKEAQQAFEVVLMGQHKELGADHPDTLVTRQNVAMVLESMGDKEAAGAELAEVMGTQIRLLGAKDPAVFRTACSLAMNYTLRGMPGEAEILFKATLKNQKKLLGDTHRDTVMTRLMMDQCLQGIGKRNP